MSSKGEKLGKKSGRREKRERARKHKVKFGLLPMPKIQNRITVCQKQRAA